MFGGKISKVYCRIFRGFFLEIGVFFYQASNKNLSETLIASSSEISFTPPKANMEPENDGSQKESPLPGVNHVSVRGFLWINTF